MRRGGLIGLLLLLALAAPAVAGPAVAQAATPSKARPQLLALRGRLGGSRIGGGGVFSRRHSLFGPRRRSSRGILRRIARTLALAYLFHLFFSHGGLSILLWIVIIVLVVMLFRRRRRRRYAY